MWEVEAPAQGYLQRNPLRMREVEATAQSYLQPNLLRMRESEAPAKLYLQPNPRSRDRAEQEPEGAKVWIDFGFFAFSGTWEWDFWTLILLTSEIFGLICMQI